MRSLITRFIPAVRTFHDDPDLPLPARIFVPYVWFWHIVTILIYLAYAAGTIWQQRAALDWRVAAVTVLLAGQLGMYLRLYVFTRRWPLPLWQHAIYFGGGIVAWLIQSHLFEHFFGLIFMLVGQSFGLLPPLPAIVTVVTILLLTMLQSAGWRIQGIDAGLAAANGGIGLFTIGTYLLLYYTMRTSSERGQLIAELEAARRELERNRDQAVELAKLRERERIARDLHDYLGHTLSALSVQLEAAQRLYRVDPQRAEAQMDVMKTQVRESMAALRRTIAGLRAPGLGDRSLRQTLMEHCVAVSQRSGINVACRIDPAIDQIPPVLAETLWMVAQEALTNVEKHAHATNVEIVATVSPHDVRLCVHDDGVGLPADAFERPGHYGLCGMRERVEGVGGVLSVRSNGQHSWVTNVEAVLPLIAQEC
jgi:signal transduction histidine kinase